MLVRNWQARLRQDERQEPPDAADWLRHNGVTVAALTLIAIQIVWMAALLSHSYFRQDDYSFLDRALTHGLSWSYLMRVDAGHMLPLGYAIAWVMARVSLYNWPLTLLSILALLAASCLALLRMLRTLFGSRPAILIPLTLYVFSPLLLAAVAWWAVALEILPLELAIFMAVDAHVRYLRGGRFRSALAAAGWLLFGMAATDKGAVVPLLLFAVTSAYFVEGRWAVAAVRAARRYSQAWVLYGALLAGYCVVFVIQLHGSAVQPATPGAGSLVSLASTMTGSTLVPGALGGPWQWLTVGYAVASPPAALQQLSWAVAALVALVSCLYRARAWRAWAILFGWVVVADIMPVAIGRLGLLPASLLGLQARYVTDAPAVLALCTGLAFLPLVGEQDGFRFRVSTTAPTGSAAWTGRVGTRSVRAATVLLLAAFLVGSFWTFQALEALTHMKAVRSYIATARVAVANAPRGTLIVDTPAPEMIMDPVFFYRQGYTSQVIGAMARGDPGGHLSWTLSPHGALRSVMIFNAQGQLRSAVVAGLSSGPPPRGRHCWSATPAGSTIPLPLSLYRWTWTIRIDHSGPAAVVALRFGGKWADVSLSAGTYAYYLPLVGQGKEVTVRQVGPSPAQCLNGITVGTWQPAPTGWVIPAAPVPG